MSPARVRPPPAARLAEMRGLVRLMVDAIVGVTRIAEGLHGQIARLAPPLGQRPEVAAPGLAGFVYRTVRATTTGVGQGLDAALSALEPAAPAVGEEDGDDAPARAAILAALNGVVGDHLARTGNPLAIPTTLRVPGPRHPHVLLLLHGLCMSDRQWTRRGHDHPARLERSLGCTPVYARYNSGRHVSEVAAEVAAQLERLLAGWPTPVEELSIVGFSMGGLVARSAVHQALLAGMQWPSRLARIVFLGTPHHGAWLERGGNWLHAVAGTSPYLAPFARLGALRSAGITDLRHGNLLASDWQHGRFHHGDTRTVVPLPTGVACYAIAGTLSRGHTARPLGDGLVSVASALGRHPEARRDLRLPAARTWVAPGTHHLDLLGSVAVEHKLRQWLSAPPPTRAAAAAHPTTTRRKP